MSEKIAKAKSVIENVSSAKMTLLGIVAAAADSVLFNVETAELI